MNFSSQKKNILKKAVNRKIASNEYPELDEAAEALQSRQKTLRGTRPVQVDSADKAFGPKRMNDPKFLKQLRKLQEKYKVTSYA